MVSESSNFSWQNSSDLVWIEPATPRSWSVHFTTALPSHQGWGSDNESLDAAPELEKWKKTRKRAEMHGRNKYGGSFLSTGFPFRQNKHHFRLPEFAFHQRSKRFLGFAALSEIVRTYSNVGLLLFPNKGYNCLPLFITKTLSTK